jgi:hypothetical protein
LLALTQTLPVILILSLLLLALSSGWPSERRASTAAGGAFADNRSASPFWFGFLVGGAVHWGDPGDGKRSLDRGENGVPHFRTGHLSAAEETRKTKILLCSGIRYSCISADSVGDLLDAEFGPLLRMRFFVCPGADQNVTLYGMTCNEATRDSREPTAAPTWFWRRYVSRP